MYIFKQLKPLFDSKMNIQACLSEDGKFIQIYDDGRLVAEYLSNIE